MAGGTLSTVKDKAIEGKLRLAGTTFGNNSTMMTVTAVDKSLWVEEQDTDVIDDEEHAEVTIDSRTGEKTAINAMDGELSDEEEKDGK